MELPRPLPRGCRSVQLLGGPAWVVAPTLGGFKDEHPRALRAPDCCDNAAVRRDHQSPEGGRRATSHRMAWSTTAPGCQTATCASARSGIRRRSSRHSDQRLMPILAEVGIDPGTPEDRAGSQHHRALDPSSREPAPVRSLRGLAPDQSGRLPGGRPGPNGPDGNDRGHAVPPDRRLRRLVDSSSQEVRAGADRGARLGRAGVDLHSVPQTMQPGG